MPFDAIPVSRCDHCRMPVFDGQEQCAYCNAATSRRGRRAAGPLSARVARLLRALLGG